MAFDEILLQHDQLFSLSIGKRFEKDAVNHTEEGCVDADAQCQRHGHHQREAGIFGQHPEAVTDIVKESTHKAPNSCGISPANYEARSLPARTEPKSLKILCQSAGPVDVISIALSGGGMSCSDSNRGACRG